MRNLVEVMQTKRSVLLLFILVIAGSILRIYGIDFGYHIDEPNIVERAIAMVGGEIYQPWYNWPAQTLMFLYAGLFWIAELFTEVPNYYIIARAVSVLAGVASIIMVFLIGKTIVKSAQAGLWAALFVATSQLLVRHSHYATPDAMMTLLLLVLVYFAIRAYQEKDAKKILRWYMWSGIILGVAIATKYTAAIGIVPILIVFIIKHRKYWNTLFWVGLSAFVAHSIVNPFALFDLDLIFQQLVVEANPNRLGQDWAGQKHFINNLYYYISNTPEWIGSLLSVLAIGGGIGSVVHAVRSKSWEYIIVPGFWFAFLLGISTLGLHWTRWALPMLPLVAIMAGIAIWRLLTLISQERIRVIIGSISGAVIIVPQLVISIVFSYSDIQPSTSDRASEWLINKREEPMQVIGDVENLVLYEPYTYRPRTNKLHEFTYDEYIEQGVDFIVLRKKDLVLRKDEPEKYADELIFFDELEERGKKVHSETKPQKTILKNKTDLAVYRWLFNPKKRARTFDLYQGEPIVVYKLR